MELTKLLQNLGLEEKETKIYLALLKLGEATATKIAESTSLDRTLIYQLANKLIEKGLISYIIKNNVKYFLASDPKKLLEDLKEKEKQLQEALPELLEIAKKEEKETKVEIYRGKEGIKTIFKDILRAKKDYVVFGEEGKFQEIMPLDFEKYLNQIVKQGIHEKVLVREDKKETALKTKNTEFRFISKTYLSPSMTVVYGEKTVNFILSEPYYAIVTTNKEMADSFRTYFQLLWKIAKF